MRKANRGAPARNQRGAMAVVAGVMVVVLIVMGGMVVDLGRMYVTRTELQSAMDACALAAANQLQPGASATAFVLQTADAHGRAMVDSTKASVNGARPTTSVNRAYFQSREIVAADVQLEFAPALDGPYATLGAANPTTARFARCSYPMTNIAVTLTQLLNIVPSAGAVAPTTTVGASAVASRAPGSAGNPTNSTTCGLFPVAVCRVPGSTSATNWGMTPGQWVGGVANPGGGGGGGSVTLEPGNFGWIDFSPPAGGASELLGLLANNGACGTIPVGTEVGQPGAISSAYAGWNSRFGIYGNGSGLSEASNPPDYTGYAYSKTNYGPAASWQPGSTVSINAFGNDYMTRRAAASVFNQTEVGYGNNNFNATRVLTSQQLRDYGRLRRVVAAPVVDCTLFHGGSGRPPIDGFACLFLLRPYSTSGPQPGFENRNNLSAFSPEIEYIGTIDDPDTPCRLSGGVGGSGGSTGSFALVPRLVQ